VDYWIRGLLRRIDAGIVHGCTVAYGSTFFGANRGEWERTEARNAGLME